MIKAAVNNPEATYKLYLPMGSISIHFPKYGRIAALAKVAPEYIEPKPALDKLKSVRKKGTKSEIRKVCPKLEKKVKDKPKLSTFLS
jgi:flagellar motility protein MotE (MotC chaperone)